MCDVVIATGEMFHDATDVDLPGRPPLRFKRSYSTTFKDVGFLGKGWRHDWQVSLRIDEDAYRISDLLGGETKFARPDCDGKKGPRVTMDREATSARLDFPDESRQVFGRLAGTAGRWLLHERCDPYGNWTRMAYESGRLASITDSEGREVRLGYTGALLGEVHIHSRGAEQRIYYEHDGVGRLVRVTDPQGFAEEFEYEDDLLVRYTNQTVLSRSFCYDERRRCVLNWYGDGLKLRRLEFSPDGHSVLLTDSYGFREVYRLNDEGKLSRMIDPLGQEYEWIYAKDGGLLCRILPDGTPLTMAVVEDGGRVLKRFDSRGTLTTNRFDAAGNVTAIENAAGLTLRFEYDAKGGVSALLGPEGAHWRYEYDERGSLSRLFNPKGEWIARKESRGEVRAWDEEGQLGSYQFDGLGNLMSDTDPLGRTTRYEYAGQNLLTRMIRPDESVIRWKYDPFGRIVAVADGLGRITRYEYSPFGSVVKTVEPDGRVTGMVVDKEENAREISNGKGETTRLEFDANFRVVKITFFDGRADLQAYDLRNRVNLFTDARGQQTRYVYDGASNPVEVGLPDGSAQRYEYDAIQRLVAITLEPSKGTPGTGSQAAFTYNANNYVTSETHDGYEVLYDYDQANNLTGIRDSLGRAIRYRLGRLGQVVGIEDGPRTYGLEYSAAGELVRIRLPNGMSQRLEFDACSRLTRREVVSRTGRVEAWRSFKYDAADQLVAMEDWRLGEFRYVYDPAGRLVQVADTRGRVLERYTYDVEGNLTASPDFPDVVLDPGNRLRRSGDSSHTYDAAGCQVGLREGPDSWEMVYGNWDRLVRLDRNGSPVASYAYDLTARRTRKTCGDEDVHFYHHANTLSTLKSPGHGRWDFLHLPFLFIPLSQCRDGRCHYYSFDQIGTPTELWDEDGRLVAAVRASAYGSARQIDWATEERVPIPFHFMGQYLDEESGLHYNRFRYYDPRTARFLTQDPFGLAVGLNLYIYPRNPMNWVDPMGLAGMTLQIKCQPSEPPPFTPCEQAALQTKVAQMNAGLYKQNRKARCTDCRKNEQKEYFEEKCGGKVPKDFQVDHVQELQVGGADKCCANLMAIPARPNGSCGSQIYHQTKDYGGVIVGAVIAPPGCNSAAKCKSDGVKRGTDTTSCEEPDPVC